MINSKKIAVGLAVLTSVLMATTSANAANRTVAGKSWDAKERFLIRARAIDVIPDESSTTSIGGEITVSDQVVPEVDFSYFFTDYIAAELIAAVTPHDMDAVGTSLGEVDLGEVWLLPPTLTLQYHFNPYGDIRPYAGAGLSYIHYFNVDNASFNSIDYDDGFGYALQAGVDVGINQNWALNFDVKKIYHQVDASVNNGAVTADVDLDPWIVGVGIAYRF